MQAVEKYLAENAKRFEAELCELLRIKSVSADSKFKNDVLLAAHWINDHFKALGYEVETHPTEGHPIVLAKSPHVPGAPTVLVYGHYDVQPPDPLPEWITPPFEPTERDGNIYARGATDDKGQMFTHIKAAEAWTRTAGSPPINLTFLIEGEEEVGSKNLVPFILKHKDKLKCDVIVVSDCSQFGPGIPAITYGLRGLAYYELKLIGTKQDLHSGTFGGGVTNPANALTKILAGLRDENGKVLIPGFYDDVVALTKEEQAQYAALPFSDEKFFAQVGVDGAFGEKGFTTLERRWARPTFDINGLTSGYQGEGGKTVLPSKASAKFSFRLVPNQDPAKIAANLRTAIAKLVPPGIKWELVDMAGSPGVLVPLESPFVAAAQRAIEIGFGKKPVFMREGGSIPIVGDFRKELGVDTLLLGWGLDDDNTHSPNEKFCLADFHRGIKSSAALWAEIAKLK